MDIFEKITNGCYTNKLERCDKNKNPDGFAAYKAEQNRIEKEFKRDALEYVGLSNHPKREKAWAMVYDHGYGDGYNNIDIVYHLDELAQLLLE